MHLNKTAFRNEYFIEIFLRENPLTNLHDAIPSHPEPDLGHWSQSRFNVLLEQWQHDLKLQERLVSALSCLGDTLISMGFSNSASYHG